MNFNDNTVSVVVGGASGIGRTVAQKKREPTGQVSRHADKQLWLIEPRFDN